MTQKDKLVDSRMRRGIRRKVESRSLPRWRVTVLCMALVTIAFLVFAIDASADAPGVYLSPSERFGVGVDLSEGPIEDYDAGQLRAGWYVDWGTRLAPAHPAGMEYVQVVRLHQLTECWPQRTCDREACPYVEPYTYTLTSPSNYATIVSIAQANPGSLWLIGNEMDRMDWCDDEGGGGGQDEMMPALYAQAYHELHDLIKDADPMAQIAIGGVVQPTPLRREYLDMVWDAYQSLYGEPMPVDVWNIHNMILNEERGSWGCEIPPGIEDDQGMLITPLDNDNIEIFKQQIKDFRKWMWTKGERDKPLIISEYGILMPEVWGFDYDRVKTFMIASFDYLTTATHDSWGYPPDDNKLVQRWVWYSLNDDDFEDKYPSHHHLFDPTTKQITALGLDYRNYIVPGDLDGDGDVDVEDIMLVASRWRTSCDIPDPDYDPDTGNYHARYDFDDDCDIDIVDIMLVVVNWGKTRD